MLVDLVDQLAIDLPQLGIQPLDLGVQTDQRLFVGEARVEIGDGVESRLLELLAHQLYHQNRRGNIQRAMRRAAYRIEQALCGAGKIGSLGVGDGRLFFLDWLADTLGQRLLLELWLWPGVEFL